jgi:hypothetical protein
VQVKIRGAWTSFPQVENRFTSGGSGRVTCEVVRPELSL